MVEGSYVHTWHILPCLKLCLLSLPDEIQAIASMMEKQAKIVVKPKEVSQEEKQRKAALLAQYANVTDEEEYPFPDPAETQCFEG